VVAQPAENGRPRPTSDIVSKKVGDAESSNFPTNSDKFQTEDIGSSHENLYLYLKPDVVD